jgi:hypothetical protein
MLMEYSMILKRYTPPWFVSHETTSLKSLPPLQQLNHIAGLSKNLHGGKTTGMRHKKRDRIKIQSRFNPISYEKPCANYQESCLLLNRAVLSVKGKRIRILRGIRTARVYFAAALFYSGLLP